VKEFNSYEEYERWKGKEPKKEQLRVKVDGDTIKFYNEKGELIKEKRFKRKDKKEREISEKLGDEKEFQYYYEEPKIISNGNYILLVKTTVYYETQSRNYEIIDGNGNLLNTIKENGEVYFSPDGSYFLFFHKDGYDETGLIDFYDKKGKLINRQQVFDYKGTGDVVFSDNSQYVCISHVGFKEHETGLFKGGVALLDNKGNILWKKINENWNIEVIKQASSSEKNIFLGGISPDNKVILLNSDEKIFGFSLSGELLWEQKGVFHAVKFSPDGTWFAAVSLLSSDRKKLLTTVKIIKSFTGEVIRTIEIPCKSNFIFDLQNDGENILLKVRNIESDSPQSTTTFLINRKGEIIRCSEVIKDIEQTDINVKLENGRLIILNKNGVSIYDIK
jgi:hypothetical protein